MRLIDADALLQEMGKCIQDRIITDFDMTATILDAPTIEPKRGEWYQIKDHKVMGEGYMWHCSVCDYRVYQDSSADYPTENYCPNCGADMREREGE